MEDGLSNSAIEGERLDLEAVRLSVAPRLGLSTGGLPLPPRAVTDMALCQDERQPMRVFSLSAQILHEREGYYAILERTQRDGLDVPPWLAWFLPQVEAAANVAERTVAHTLARARFWLRHQAITLNERQRKERNRLLDVGPRGFEGGLTTRKHMGLTRTSRATAYRVLADRVQKGCLVPTGKGGRSNGYEIAG